MSKTMRINKFVVFVLLVVGWVLSPKYFTDKIILKAERNIEQFYNINNIKHAALNDDNFVFICFQGRDLNNSSNSEFEVDIQIEEGIISRSSTSRIRINPDSIRGACPTDMGYMKSVSASEIDSSSLMFKSHYERLLKHSNGNAVYKIKDFGNENEFVVVMKGNEFINDGYALFSISPKVHPPKKYYYLLLPVAFLLDAVLFPVEWFFLYQFNK